MVLVDILGELNTFLLMLSKPICSVIRKSLASVQPILSATNSARLYRIYNYCPFLISRVYIHLYDKYFLSGAALNAQPSTRIEAKQIREHILINEGWRFYKYGAADHHDALLSGKAHLRNIKVTELVHNTDGSIK